MWGLSWKKSLLAGERGREVGQRREETGMAETRDVGQTKEEEGTAQAVEAGTGFLGRV